MIMNNNKKIVLSGIRATGNLHLGNYYGALSKFVRMQDDYDCRYFVADLHALTTAPDPDILHENVKNILAEYLAAGLDPEKNTIYVERHSRNLRNVSSYEHACRHRRTDAHRIIQGQGTQSTRHQFRQR